MGLVVRLLVCLAGLILLGGSAQGQRLADFFQQKKTQLDYLLQQIGYLEIYRSNVNRGYEIMGAGLNLVKGFTGDEYQLHKDFFGSLKKVNPLIEKQAKVAEVFQMQQVILKAFDHIGKLELSEENLARVYLIKEGMLNECEKDIKELLLLMNAGSLESRDAQRLVKLIKIHTSMSEKLDYSVGLLERLRLFCELKNVERLNLEKLRRWYEIN